MHFGLRNAAQAFQRFMDRLFNHLSFLFIYLDEHIIGSRTLEEHIYYYDHLGFFAKIRGVSSIYN
jgi:hypothetical protein